MMSVLLPIENQDLYQVLLQGLIAALGDKLYGIYIYGAAAFPDSEAIGDIDFHVILAEGLTEEERGAIQTLHCVLARDFPPLGAELDGYYLLMDAARQPALPVHQLNPQIRDESWALHRQHIRAGRCIVLYGPAPQLIYPPATWPEIESALWGELKYVREHLRDYPAYCILNLCRLMYSFETRDVVISKMGAAAWAWDKFQEWRCLIELAKRSYARQATPGDRQFMLDEVEGLYRFACDRIGVSQDAGGPFPQAGSETQTSNLSHD